MSGFSADWLALRAPFDDAARSPGLARRFASGLPDRPRLVDLGAGTGAGRRALGPLLGGRARWTFVEGDPALLRRALAQADPPLARARGECRNLAADWSQVLGPGCDGVTAFALIDLATAGWIDRLAALLVRRRLPFYAPLVVDGRVRWTPGDPSDALVGRLFHSHQRRPKGLGHGPALGPAAPAWTMAAFRRRGARVFAAPSDWTVPAAESAMLAAMLEGAAAAAAEQSPADRPAIAAWADRRRRQLADGQLSLVVGHQDLLVLPAMEWAAIPGRSQAAGALIDGKGTGHDGS